MTGTLVPIAVPGTDRQLMATSVDGRPVVSLRHACEAISIDFSRQLRKLREKSWAGVVMMSTPSAGGDQQTAMIDRRTFTMWLATIDAGRVSPGARPIIEAFQAEAADALDAYFNEGGAINPRANEDQLDRLARQAQAQAAVLQALKGVVDPKHLEAKGRIILARALGEAPEINPADVPLYVSDFLKTKLRPSMVPAKLSAFGKKAKAAYILEYDRAPEMHLQNMGNGQVREACAYTEADRPLLERVWARYFANVVAEGALFAIEGGVS